MKELPLLDLVTGLEVGSSSYYNSIYLTKYLTARADVPKSFAISAEENLVLMHRSHTLV